MANTYFQFKQFTIQQDRCAMKVCTDACLFGAVVAHCPPCLPAGSLPGTHCLDIGTGTGLLSLMVAQKDPDAVIDAVEIDKTAFQQAKENFESSPWKDRLHIFNTDITNFKTDNKYDLIICNPPFFENDLRSTDEIKNKAKHGGSLNFDELLKIAVTFLSDKGSFALLLPYHRVTSFEIMAAAQNLYLSNKILVRQTAAHSFFRGILIFSKEKKEIKSAEIVIKNREGEYTTEFTGMLKDYYLHV